MVSAERFETLGSHPDGNLLQMRPMPIAIFVGESEDQLRAGKGKRAYTTTQAAALLGITERYIRRLVLDGKITPYEERIFQVPLFVEEEIMTLRENRTKRY